MQNQSCSANLSPRCFLADFILEGDLVDACKPGDRVMITGVYRPLAGKASATLGAFRSVVVVNSVAQLSHTSSAAAEITADDLKEMKRLAAKPNVLDVLGKSMAPSIYGHEWIKKVCIFLLLALLVCGTMLVGCNTSLIL